MVGDAQLVSVVFADSGESARIFFAERGGEWPVLGQEYSRVVIDFGATGIPQTYVVCPDGVVVAGIRGDVTHDGLDDLIDADR